MNQASVLEAGLSETSGGALSVTRKEFDLAALDEIFDPEPVAKLRCENGDTNIRGSLELRSVNTSSLIGSYSLLALLQGD